MLEDSSMEVKLAGRSVPTASKGNGTETKTKQDAVNGKPFTKAGRRRELVGSNGPKPEPNRKPLPQKSKALDKRPRPRAQYFNSGKDSGQVAEAEKHEYGSHSLYFQGSKKQNLNHLLNFHYTPRDGALYSSSWCADRDGHGDRPGGRRKWSCYNAFRPKYNKEQFLQANCQFIVKADGDYTVHFTDPDILVEWDNIEQICLKSHEVPWCPICLYSPVAAKITRCGHIYCWSCVLHYLSLSNDTWRKCPICYESIHKHDLKSVISMPYHQYKIREEITMRLMRRDRNSLFAVPVMQHESYLKDTLLNVSETAIGTGSNKLLLATAEQVKQLIMDREKTELQAQLAEEKDQPESCFIEQALELLALRERALFPQTEVDAKMLEKMKLTDDSSMNKTYDDSLTPMKHMISEHAEIKQIVYKSAFDDEVCVSPAASGSSSGSHESDPLSPELPIDVTVADSEDTDNPSAEAEVKDDTVELMGTTPRPRHESTGSEDGQTVTAKDLDISNVQKSSQSAGHNGQQPKQTFYFYQIADGQHIYLHALNTHMLVREYGSLENCPLFITGRIVEKDSTSMTEELRNRLRYLKHLPVTCQFEVVELHLQPPVVSRKVISEFQGQIDRRQKNRTHRAREERKREKRIQVEENMKLGRYPPARIRIKSKYHFPECGEDGTTATRKSESPATTSDLSMPTSPTSSASSRQSSGFDLSAAVTGSGSEVSSSIKTPVESTGPSFAQMVREGKMKSPVLKPTVNSSAAENCSVGAAVSRPRNMSDSDTDLEDYAAAPEFHHSFSDAITLALEKAAAEKKDATVEGSTGKGKKKKKGKQKLLFTTNLTCPGK